MTDRRAPYRSGVCDTVDKSLGAPSPNKNKEEKLLHDNKHQTRGHARDLGGACACGRAFNGGADGVRGRIERQYVCQRRGGTSSARDARLLFVHG